MLRHYSSSKALTSTLLGLLVSSMLAGPGLAKPASKPEAKPEKNSAYAYFSSSRLLDLSPWTGDSYRGYKKGFVTTQGSVLRFSDGSRARFWGVNIANRNLWISHAEIDTIVDTLHRSGVNMVRFEALDSRGGMLDIPGHPGSRKMDTEKLDTVHYWISQLRKKGIYYYLDLIDFREFTTEDGIENAKAIGRAGRPYAMFADELIALQKEYAQQLLTTTNPYTHLKPVDDPGLALLEICNESGFWLYPKQTDNLVEPYRTQLQIKWTQWLRKKYPDRASLEAAWGTALGADEDPANGNVRLPKIKAVDPPARQRDGMQFLYTVERQYFATMRDYLHQLGLKIPITAVVSSDVPMDLAAVSAELDFMSENHYTDHPAFGGSDWEGKFFYNNRNCLKDGNRFQFAPFTAQLRWDAKPVVIREWAAVWPNQYRASSVPEAAAYARMQDYDGMLLFGYKAGAVGDRLVEFGYQVDPTVWDLFGQAAILFLRGDVTSPSQMAVLEFSPERLFGSQNTTDMLKLAYTQRLSCTTPQGKMPIGDVTVWPIRDEPLEAEPILKSTAIETGGYALQDSVYRSLNGQIARDLAKGRLTVATPRTCSISGELSSEVMKAGTMSVQSASPIGAIMATSLDGEPLETSQHYILKMVTVAENTGQRLVPTQPGAPSSHILDQPGLPPVLTKAAASDKGTVVSIGGEEIVRVGQLNGTWELVVSPKGTRFWSDLPNPTVYIRGQQLDDK